MKMYWNRIRISLLIVAVLLGVWRVNTTQARQNAAPTAKTLYQQALHEEEATGNLKAAIALYERALSAKPDRALAAQTLIHMADCYQKLGSAEAQKIYERILRDYPDQNEAAAIARTHLTPGNASASVKGDRVVWGGGFVDGFGTISPDGRFLTYTDWARDLDLMLRDLTNGTDRPLTKGSRSSGENAQFSAISKDGKQVAYEWIYSDKRIELRVASLQGTGIPAYRRILQNDDIQNIFPTDWSPDGKWIAARLTRKDRTTQIALISSQDGALRVLKSTDWGDRNGKIFFSPDGKYLAYELTNANAPTNSGIFIITVDGRRETAAVTYPGMNQIMGWLPDGKHLLFASERTGSPALWAIRVVDGKPEGQPVLVKSNIGPTHWSLGITASGTLYTWKNTGSTYVQVSAVDLNTGKLQGQPAGVFQRFIASRGRPEWSADGKQLAFQSCSAGGGGPCSLFVWSMKTGQVREVTHQLNYFNYMSWSPDGRALLAGGNDAKGKPGIYRIDADTGATSIVVDDSSGYAQWAPDGKSVYYKPANRRDVILNRDLASGAERELVRVPAGSYFTFFSVSPDHRAIALVSSEDSVVVAPLDGGQLQNVFHVNTPERLRANLPLSWTPDGHNVIVTKIIGGNNRMELWKIPVDGRQPHKLDIDNDGDGYRLSPDGKYIAFVGTAGKSGSEIWALENLAPLSKAK